MFKNIILSFLFLFIPTSLFSKRYAFVFPNISTDFNQDINSVSPFYKDEKVERFSINLDEAVFYILQISRFLFIQFEFGLDKDNYIRKIELKKSGYCISIADNYFYFFNGSSEIKRNGFSHKDFSNVFVIKNDNLYLSENKKNFYKKIKDIGNIPFFIKSGRSISFKKNNNLDNILFDKIPNSNKYFLYAFLLKKYIKKSNGLLVALFPHLLEKRIVKDAVADIERVYDVFNLCQKAKRLMISDLSDIDLNYKHLGLENSYYYAKKINLSSKGTVLSIGDLHGSAKHVINLINKLILNKKMSKKFDINGDNVLAITGDFIDRGFCQIWTLYYMLELYVRNPDKVLLLKGNHETFLMARSFGFYTTLLNIPYLDNNIYANYLIADFFFNQFLSTLSLLPSAGFVLFKDCKKNTKNTLMFSHGSFDKKYDPSFFLSKDDIRLDRLNDIGIINNEKNYFIWGDILDNPHPIDKNGLNQRLLELEDFSFKDCFSFMKKNKIDGLFVGHQHRDNQLDLFGIAKRKFNKHLLFRHIQSYGDTFVEGEHHNFGYKSSILSIKRGGFFKKLSISKI